MDYFPVFAKLEDKRCLVVGGGAVACRKVAALRKAGARVTVNAPELNDELAALAAEGAVTHIARPYDPALIPDHLLIVAATADREVNKAVAADAGKANRLCNVVDDGELSGFIMPSVIDRSPVIVAVSSGGRSPVLTRLLRQRLDAWLPSRIGDLARWAGTWRVRVRDRLRNHADRLRFWERILDGDVAERILSGDRAAADATMTRELDRPATSSHRGAAWIVGAGPGDPGLITRRGLKLLERADVVLYDRLVTPELLASARRDAEFICVGKLSSQGSSKRSGKPSTPQADINALLVARVRRGQRVCRLKGGDPFVFGRGGEEIQALAEAGLPYEAVPGISAANGCAAYAGIPLTHRAVAGAVTLITGHRAAGQAEPDWANLAGGDHTLVIYMGVQRLESVCDRLMHHGRAPDTPAALVENGTTENQRVVGGHLGNIAARAAGAAMGSPGLLIVGPVVDLADKLAWIDDGNDKIQWQAAGGTH